MGESHLQARLDRDLATRAKPGGVIYLIAVFAVAVPAGLLQEQPVFIAAFAGLQFVLACYRWYWTHWFSLLYPGNPTRWHRGLVLGVTLNAALWGLFAALIILLGGPVESALVSLAGSSGLAAGGTAAFSPDRRLLKPYLLLLLLPSAIAASLMANRLGFSMAFASIIFLFFFWRLGQKQCREYWNALHDNEQLKRQAVTLEQARVDAEAAVRSKDAFLATMSHELRTPMNAVIGAGHLLLNTPVSREQQDYTETIITGGNTLLRIINDILDYSKLQADKLTLEHRPFDLRDCVEGALDLVGIKAAEKGLDLAYFIDPAVPTMVVGECIRLRQIVINLVTNAVKFTEQGHVILRVSSYRVSGYKTSQDLAAPDARGAGQPVMAEPPHRVTFSIEDTGIGMASDQIDQLFEPFVQADASITRRYGGTGLGLTIARQLVELMGGTLCVESEEGAGSTFFFTIPVRAVPGPIPEYLCDEIPEFAEKRVLLIDDNPAIRNLLTAHLTRWGLAVYAVPAGSKVSETLRTTPSFDLILADQKVFDIKGRFAPELRATPAPANTPLVVMAPAGSRTRAALTREGVDVLSKPVKPSALYPLLLHLFKSRSEPSLSCSNGLERHASLSSTIPLRILLAEDNPVNKKLLLRQLEQLGYQADWVGNGLDVIRRLESEPYDLILMDVQMPGMDGLEATRVICRTWVWPDRPWIVAVTANAMPEDRKKCLDAGMDDYLSKPVRPEALQEALQQCMVSRVSHIG